MCVTWRGGQVLARLTGREEVVFGTVLFGRMQAGARADQAVGLFMNTLPLRVTIDDRSVQEGLRQTHQRLGELLGHEHASLVLAQRCSEVPSPAPLFTTLLNYRHIQGNTSEQTARAFEGVTRLYGEERTNYPLVLSVDDLGEAIGLTAQVSAEIDPQRICELIQNALAELVRALQGTRGDRCGRWMCCLPAEREQILEQWNADAGSLSRGAVHSRVVRGTGGAHAECDSG